MLFFFYTETQENLFFCFQVFKSSFSLVFPQCTLYSEMTDYKDCCLGP